MRTTRKILLLTEAVVCFGPALLLLIFGAALFPFLAQDLFQRSGIAAPIFLSLQILGGGLGMISVLAMLTRLMDQESRFLSPFKVNLFLVSGFLSASTVLIPAWWDRASWLWVVPLMPMLSAAHIFWLSRLNFRKKSIDQSSVYNCEGEHE